MLPLHFFLLFSLAFVSFVNGEGDGRFTLYEDEKVFMYPTYGEKAAYAGYYFKGDGWFRKRGWLRKNGGYPVDFYFWNAESQPMCHALLTPVSVLFDDEDYRSLYLCPFEPKEPYSPSAHEYYFLAALPNVRFQGDRCFQVAHYRYGDNLLVNVIEFCEPSKKKREIKDGYYLIQSKDKSTKTILYKKVHITKVTPAITKGSKSTAVTEKIIRSNSAAIDQNW